MSGGTGRSEALPLSAGVSCGPAVGGADRLISLKACPPYSYFQSGSSGCFKSHRGRRLWTVGMVSKLYAGGGEVVAHSSVQAPHGLSPAGRPWRHDTITLYTKMR